MNLVDIFLFLVILLSVWSGYQKGFILGVSEIITWLGSLALTFRFYPYAVNWFDGRSATLSPWTIPLAFIVTFVLIRIVVGLAINWLLGAVPYETHKTAFNRTFGIFPGLVNGLIYAALLATFLLIVPVSNGISEASRDSRLASKLTEPVALLEDKLSPIFDEVVRKTIGRLTVEPESGKFIKLPYHVAHPKVRPDLEAKMLELVNEERVKNGLQPLEADPEMQQVARKHSVDMFARGYFSHYTPEKKDPFDRMRSAHVKFITAGENLALARTLIMAHEGLMHSPGHRANILQSAFGRVGIGIMDGGIYGIMVTQNFRN